MYNIGVARTQRSLGFKVPLVWKLQRNEFVYNLHRHFWGEKPNCVCFPKLIWNDSRAFCHFQAGNSSMPCRNTHMLKRLLVKITYESYHKSTKQNQGVQIYSYEHESEKRQTSTVSGRENVAPHCRPSLKTLWALEACTISRSWPNNVEHVLFNSAIRLPDLCELNFNKVLSIPLVWWDIPASRIPCAWGL